MLRCARGLGLGRRLAGLKHGECFFVESDIAISTVGEDCVAVGDALPDAGQALSGRMDVDAVEFVVRLLNGDVHCAKMTCARHEHGDVESCRQTVLLDEAQRVVDRRDDEWTVVKPINGDEAAGLVGAEPRLKPGAILSRDAWLCGAIETLVQVEGDSMPDQCFDGRLRTSTRRLEGGSPPLSHRVERGPFEELGDEHYDRRSSTHTELLVKFTKCF